MVGEKWDVAAGGAHCASCGVTIDPGLTFHSILAAQDGVLVRSDWCETCWAGADAAAPGAIAHWRTARAPREAPRRRYAALDLDLVWSIFCAMHEAPEGGALEGELKYVLALILLRRRRLELAARAGGVLSFRDKERRVYPVADPTLSEARVAELTDRLGELLWEREFAGAGGAE